MLWADFETETSLLWIFDFFAFFLKDLSSLEFFDFERDTEDSTIELWFRLKDLSCLRLLPLLLLLFWLLLRLLLLFFSFYLIFPRDSSFVFLDILETVEISLFPMVCV